MEQPRIQRVWAYYTSDGGVQYFVRIRKRTALVGGFDIVSDLNKAQIGEVVSEWPYQPEMMRKIRVKRVHGGGYLDIPISHPSNPLFSAVGQRVNINLWDSAGQVGGDATTVEVEIVSRRGEKIRDGGFVMPPEFGLG